jgi:hypothetical protein
MEVVTPWEALRKVELRSLQRMMQFLRAVKKAENGEDDGLLFGAAGAAIAQEIANYCAVQEKRKISTDITPQESRAEEAPEDTSQEMLVIRKFRECFTEKLNSPAKINWGRDRKLIRQLFADGWRLEQILSLIPVFMSSDRYTFRDGSFLSFSRTMAILRKLQEDTQVNNDIPSHLRKK